jgi:hypothetical protein
MRMLSDRFVPPNAAIRKSATGRVATAEPSDSSPESRLCIFGSSEESVGEFWLRKLAKHVMRGEFCDSERPTAIRFSQCDFGLAVQALDDAAGELLLGLKIAEQQLPVSAHGAVPTRPALLVELFCTGSVVAEIVAH